MPSLKESLTNVLPKDKSYDVFHWQSTSRDTHPLITTASNTTTTQFKTVKCEHFITLAHKERIIFGLEVFVYITIDYHKQTTEKLLFVSKADTTGHNESKVKIGLITQEIIKYLLRIPLDSYLQSIIPKEATSRGPYDKTTINKYTKTKEALDILLKRHQGQLTKPPPVAPYSITEYPQPVHTKIALFTRSEPQYLFPNSSKVSTKHVLSGDGLLKWWLKCLDPVICDAFDQYSAFLNIPAEDEKVVQRYLTPLKSHWSIGDMFTRGDGGDDSKAIAVFRIPLFPDDPKARFLEHLVVENRATSVTVKQFWEELQIRQEFRLGVVVSVIGVDGTLKGSLDSERGMVFPQRKFKQLKGYITADDYATEDGGLEAYKNIMNYLESVVDDELDLSVTGAFTSIPVQVVNTLGKQSEANNLTMLVRKKQKK